MDTAQTMEGSKMSEAFESAMSFISMIFGALVKLGGYVEDFFEYTIYAIGDVLELLDPDKDLIETYNYLEDYFYALGNFLVQSAADGVVWVLGFIPSIAVPSFAGELSGTFIQSFNWLFPTNYLITCIGILALSSLSWVTVGVLGRWIKLWS